MIAANLVERERLRPRGQNDETTQCEKQAERKPESMASHVLLLKRREPVPVIGPRDSVIPLPRRGATAPRAVRPRRVRGNRGQLVPQPADSTNARQITLLRNRVIIN